MRNSIVAALVFCLCPLLAQNQQTASYPAAPATDQTLLVANNFYTSTLTAGINLSAMSIPVASTAGLSYPTAVVIQTGTTNEIIKVCGASGGALTVCAGGRGFDSTAQLAHVKGDKVFVSLVAAMYNRVSAELKAVETTLPPGTADNQVQLWSVSQQRWVPTNTPATINVGSVDATAIRGRSVASTAPTDGQTLCWNATNSEYRPCDGGGGGGSLGYTAENVANKGAISGYAPLDNAQHLPAANTAALTGDVTKAAGNSSTVVTALQGRAVVSTAPTANQLLGWNNSVSQWQPMTPTAAMVTNAADTTIGYLNPSWIASLAYGKLTGVPSTFTPSAHASTHGNAGSDPVTLLVGQVTNAATTAGSNTFGTGTQTFGGTSHYIDMALGNAANQVTNDSMGTYQTLVEPSCAYNRLGGNGQIATCLLGYLSGNDNPASGANLIGAFEQYAMQHGHNTDDADGSVDKKTFTGRRIQSLFGGAGQKYSIDNEVGCFGVGDCIGLFSQMNVRSFTTANGDEGNGALNIELLEYDHVFQPTTGTLVKSTCTGTLPNGVTKSTGTGDLKTANFTRTSGACSIGDVLSVDTSNSLRREIIVLTAVGAGTSTITAIFQSSHGNGAAVAPSPVLNPGGFPFDRVDAGWGQGQWVVDLQGTTYTTGTAAPSLGGNLTVTGSGTTWKTGHTNGPVGGDANYPGCIAWPSDDVTGVRGFDVSHPLRSWYPIASVDADGQITLAVTYMGKNSASRSYIWAQCTDIGRILMSYNQTAELISGIALFANAFPWTSGHQVEETLHPKQVMQHGLYIGTGWWGPGELTANVVSENVGMTTISDAYRVSGVQIGSDVPFHHAFNNLGNTDQGAISVTGLDLSGVAIALGTYSSPVADYKKIYWGGVVEAGIGPDPSAGFFIDTPHIGKFALKATALTGGTVLFDYSGIGSNNPVITIPASSTGGILGIITGSSPANNDCAKFSVSGGVTTLVTSGGGCGGSGLPANVTITNPPSAVTMNFSAGGITTTLVPGTLIASTGSITQYKFPYFADTAGQQLASWSGGPIGDNLALASGAGYQIGSAVVLAQSGTTVSLGSTGSIVFSPDNGGFGDVVDVSLGATSGHFSISKSTGASDDYIQGKLDTSVVWNVDVTGTAKFPSVIVSSIPTSCSGKPTGTLWNNSGVVNVCP